MITLKDLNDIAENKIKNEAQKAIIRSSFPPHIADRMCAAIDGQEKMEHFIRFLKEYNEWMVEQQMVVQEFGYRLPRTRLGHPQTSLDGARCSLGFEGV